MIKVVQCGECLFWGCRDDATDVGAYRQCMRIKHDKKRVSTPVWSETYLDSDPDDAKELAEGREFLRTNSALVVDVDGYFAALKTKAHFGCPLGKLEV